MVVKDVIMWVLILIYVFFCTLICHQLKVTYKYKKRCINDVESLNSRFYLFVFLMLSNVFRLVFFLFIYFFYYYDYVLIIDLNNPLSSKPNLLNYVSLPHITNVHFNEKELSLIFNEEPEELSDDIQKLLHNIQANQKKTPIDPFTLEKDEQTIFDNEGLIRCSGKNQTREDMKEQAGLIYNMKKQTHQDEVNNESRKFHKPHKEKKKDSHKTNHKKRNKEENDSGENSKASSTYISLLPINEQEGKALDTKVHQSNLDNEIEETASSHNIEEKEASEENDREEDTINGVRTNTNDEIIQDKEKDDKEEDPNNNTTNQNTNKDSNAKNKLLIKIYKSNEKNIQLWIYLFLNFLPSLLYISVYSMILHTIIKVYYIFMLESSGMFKQAIFYANILLYLLFFSITGFTFFSSIYLYKAYMLILLTIFYFILATLLLYFGNKLTTQLNLRQRYYSIKDADEYIVPLRQNRIDDGGYMKRNYKSSNSPVVEKIKTNYFLKIQERLFNRNISSNSKKDLQLNIFILVSFISLILILNGIFNIYSAYHIIRTYVNYNYIKKIHIYLYIYLISEFIPNICTFSTYWSNKIDNKSYFSGNRINLFYCINNMKSVDEMVGRDIYNKNSHLINNDFYKEVDSSSDS